MTTIQLGTWNCNNGCDARDRPFDFRQPNLLTLLEGLDLLFVQEIPLIEEKPNGELVRLLDRVGLANHIWSHLDTAHNREAGVESGLLTASRFPLGRGETKRFSNPHIRAEVEGKTWASHNKAALAVPVLAPRAPLLALNVHLLPYQSFGHSPGDNLPMQTWRELEEIVLELSDNRSRLVVGGDFNRTESTLVHLRGLVHGETTRIGGESHDNIFVPSDIQSGPPKILRSPSDHFLVLGEVTCQQ